MPSMSHSGFVTRSGEAKSRKEGKPGWWEDVVNTNENAGISLNKFRVISASPLGGPYGTTSPLTIDPRTGRAYRSQFPLITPLDQARVHAFLLDALGIESVHAIVGASMGGMQVLQFAVHYPQRYERVIAICTTGQSSPSTQALRSVQRAAVRIDPHFFDGNYADNPSANGGPMAGMGIARMFGTICYRSREEFDARFSNRPLTHNSHHHATTGTPKPTSTSQNKEDRAAESEVVQHLFEVEKYLFYQASTFTGRYDANCYLALSQCMDLMDLAMDSEHVSSDNNNHATSTSKQPPKLSYEQACGLVPRSKQLLLLPIASDALIPPSEMERLGSVLGSQGKRVHFERIHSIFGHDAFLKEYASFNPRFGEFLDPSVEDGVENVRKYVNSLFDL